VTKYKDLSPEDKKNWQDYIKNPSDVFDKDKSNSINAEKKSRFRFDLHGFTLDQANKKVKEIILSCTEKKYKEILFITGKGKHSTNDKDIYTSKDLGRLKYSVPEFINSDQELRALIVSIQDAKIKDGGEGAIIIKLKNL
jgi:DNA-nicking Smr family endonuclease|tara:strand:+ start:11166 stop:11585 length:420 start_codon:yes stop_codon:yes gene_type:complete